MNDGPTRHTVRQPEQSVLPKSNNNCLRDAREKSLRSRHKQARLYPKTAPSQAAPRTQQHQTAHPLKFF
eukprot:scaffold506505_cov15-Prasinocladus_malaysianus.AAC.1